jgi:hypothetical protein
MQQFGRTLLILGAVLIVVGALLYFGGKLPFRLGKLPGDIAHRGGTDDLFPAGFLPGHKRVRQPDPLDH